MSDDHGGNRTGAGRPSGDSGRELKAPASVRVYPSKMAILLSHGVTLQQVVDDAVEREMKRKV